MRSAYREQVIEALPPTLARKLAAEAIGSFFLFATVVGSGIMGEALAGGNVAVALLGNTIATGAILFVLITALGPLSGAHFNPAVTLVFALRREIGVGPAIGLIMAQLAGGLIGVVAANAMFDLPLVQFSTHPRTGSGQWLGEGIATFGLIFTILATLRSRPDWVAPAVALYITAGYWFTSSTSFANPAITVGRAFTDSFSGIAAADVPGFIAAQLAGAVFAWLVCTWLFAEKERLH